MAETIAELRALTDDELIERHDLHARSVVVATKHYLDELARRDSARREERMLALTEEIARMTGADPHLHGGRDGRDAARPRAQRLRAPALGTCCAAAGADCKACTTALCAE